MDVELCERARLAESVRFYAIKLAAKYFRKEHPLFEFDDVVQAAMLGAMEAALKYDFNHASKANFMTYAVYPMRNRVLALYRTSTPAHIPRCDYNAMPSAERGKHIWGSHVSLSTPAFRSQLGEEDVTLETMLPDQGATPADKHLEAEVRKQQVREMVAALSKEERKIVNAVFGLSGFSEVRVSEIASYRGVSRQAVYQQLTGALKKLERMAVSRGLYV